MSLVSGFIGKNVIFISQKNFSKHKTIKSLEVASIIHNFWSASSD